MHRFFSTSQAWAPLVMRLALGIVMWPHGAQKLLGLFGGQGFEGTVKGMGSMGMPSIIVVLVIIGEFFGALGLITGFLTRFCAAALALIMLGAVVHVHAKNGFFMNWFGNQPGEGFEYHLLAIGLGIALMLTGGGRWSVDGEIAKRLAKS